MFWRNFSTLYKKLSHIPNNVLLLSVVTFFWEDNWVRSNSQSNFVFKWGRVNDRILRPSHFAWRKSGFSLIKRFKDENLMVEIPLISFITWLKAVSSKAQLIFSLSSQPGPSFDHWKVSFRLLLYKFSCLGGANQIWVFPAIPYLHSFGLPFVCPTLSQPLQSANTVITIFLYQK